jgi:hypothetical protein
LAKDRLGYKPDTGLLNQSDIYRFPFGAKIIQDGHVMTEGHQAFCDMAPNEPGTAGDRILIKNSFKAL